MRCIVSLWAKAGDYWQGGEGTIYLIHFAQPYRHARHYLGWTADLDVRLEAHRRGNGSRIMSVITAAGVEWRLAKTWHGDRNLERRIKRNGGLARCCPECGGRRFHRLANNGKEQTR